MKSVIKFFLIVFFVLIFCGSVFGYPDWADNSCRYKRTLDLNTVSTLDENYTMLINFDTQSQILDGNINASCSDLWVYDKNQAIFLDRNVLGCNLTDTNIMFKLKYGLSAGAGDKNFVLYYGGCQGGAKSDFNGVFAVGDAWEFGSLTATHPWINSGGGGGSLTWNSFNGFGNSGGMIATGTSNSSEPDLTAEYFPKKGRYQVKFKTASTGEATQLYWHLQETDGTNIIIVYFYPELNYVELCDATSVGTGCGASALTLGKGSWDSWTTNAWYDMRIDYNGDFVWFRVDDVNYGFGAIGTTKSVGRTFFYPWTDEDVNRVFDDFLAYPLFPLMDDSNYLIGDQNTLPVFGDVNIVYPNHFQTFVSQLPPLDTNLLIQFDVNTNYMGIEDSNNLFADIYYSSTAGAKTNQLYDDLNLMCMAGVGADGLGSCTPNVDFNCECRKDLDPLCSDQNFDTQLVRCVADWNTFTAMDGNFFIDVEIFKDTSSLKTDSSDYAFTIDQNFSAIWIGLKDYGVFDINSWQPFNANPVALCDDSNAVQTVYSFAGSGCQLIEFELDSDATNGIAWGSTSTYANDLNLSTDGNWGLRVRATDWANNVSDWNTVFVLLDKSVPDANTTDIFPATDATPTFWIIVSDSKSGLSGVNDCDVNLWKNSSLWATYQDQTVSSGADHNCSLTNTGNPLSVGDTVYAIWNAVDNNSNRTTDIQSAVYTYSADCTPAGNGGTTGGTGGGGGTGLRCAGESDSCVFDFDCCEGLKCVLFPDGVKRCAKEIGVNLIVSPVEIVPSIWVNTLPDYELKLQPIFVLNDSDVDATVNFSFTCAVKEFCASDWCNVIDLNDVFFSLPSRTERAVNVVCLIPSDVLMGATYSTSLTFVAGTTQKSTKILIPVRGAVLGGVGEFLSEGIYCPFTSFLKTGVVCFNENYAGGCWFSIGSEPFLLFDVFLPLGFVLSGLFLLFAVGLSRTGFGVWLVLACFVLFILTIFAFIFGCI